MGPNDKKGGGVPIVVFFGWDDISIGQFVRESKPQSSRRTLEVGLSFMMFGDGDGRVEIDYFELVHEIVECPTICGDFNYDGTVDAADYVTWRKNDGEPDGYSLWRTNFRKTLGGGLWQGQQSHQPVPEPRTMLPLFLGAAIGLRRSRQWILGT
jgi:hypothetical protein